MTRLFRALMLILATQTAAVALSLDTSAHAAPAPSPASDFTLRSIDGVPVTLSSFRGQVVVLSFWATWCGPCKEEMQHLQAIYKELEPKGFVVLSISTDDARTASQVKPFIRTKAYTFPVLLDSSSAVVGVYNPNKTLPWTVIIDKQGNVVETHAGFNPGDEVTLKAAVQRYLAQ